MQDQEIISLYWNRNEDAIVQTQKKYGRYCHTIAWNILRNQEDSEECTNDTWMHAWNAIPPERPSILRAFLGKITRNLALNRYENSHAAKRGGGEVLLCLDELAECLADSSRGRTEDATDRMTLVNALNTFLQTLGTEERKMFVRRYWYMDSVREIAARYGFSESKVKMSLLRTRERLKKHLEKEGIPV